MFTKVIWATDGSEHADRAMEHAVSVARRDGAELHVVHVIEKLVSGRASGMDAFANEDELKLKIERQARELAQEDDLATSVHILTVAGNHVGDRIAEIAQHIGADLIVVGTRGHGAVSSLMLGSVTQRLMQVSRAPVLAVPPGVGGASASPGQTVATTA